MDDDRKLVEEVIFLHSLWHQGPPPPIHTPPPPQNHTKNTSEFLHFIHPMVLKLPQRHLDPLNFRRRSENKIKNKINSPGTRPDPKWESNPPIPDQNTDLSIWPPFDSKSGSSPPPPPSSAEEISISRAKKIQIEALRSCKNFLWKSTTENDESDLENSEEEEEEEDEDYKGGIESFNFFLNLFVEDVGMREYYEEKFEGGVFFCLVCDGRGKMMRRSYSNCFALVQHCVSISKTVKKTEHKEFVKVICKVLGWNVDRLPTIVLSSEECLGQSLLKHGHIPWSSKAHT